jgi:hypothetical protein
MRAPAIVASCSCLGVLLLAALCGCVGDANCALGGAADGPADGLADGPASGDADLVDGSAPAEDAGNIDVRPGCIEGDFQPYYGDIHDHTSYSDGKLTPADAFAYARGKLEVLIVTDHLIWTDADEWRNCRSQADAANVAGEFVADCGYELQVAAPTESTPANTSHANVFFDSAPAADPATAGQQVSASLAAFFSMVSGCEGCVVQLNHPGYAGACDGSQNPNANCMAWQDLTFHPEVDAQVALCELNGGGDWQRAGFFEALAEGWHVSPTLNSDTHQPTWGDQAWRTGFYLEELSRAQVKRSMQERRTFAASTRDLSIKMLADGRCWMGSRLLGAGRTAIQVEANDASGDGSGFLSVVLYGPDKREVASTACSGATTCMLDATLEIPAESLPTHVVAVALTNAAGWLISAPIWFE